MLKRIEPYQAVIFDMDGTLVNSEDIAHQVFSDVLKEFGYHITPEDSCRRFAGRNMTECINEVSAELASPLPSDFEDEFRRRSAVAFEAELMPFEGVVELLQSLNVPVAVASNGPRHKIELNLRLAGLADFFADRVLSAYEVGIWKPDPGLFLKAAETMHCEASHCLVIEDTVHGLNAARDAAMDALIYCPAGSDDRLPDDAPIFRHYREVTEFLLAVQN